MTWASDILGSVLSTQQPIELPGFCECRLSLVTGTPYPTTSQSAKSTIYLTPTNKGNRISLADSRFTRWTPRAVSSDRSVAVPATFFRLFDVFAYWSGTAVELETVNWDQSTGSLTAATAATPSVITSAGHGLSDGDLVGLDGLNNTVGTDATNGLNDTVWTVANKTANTFEPEGSQCAGLAASTTGTWYKIPNTRTTALTTQDGRYVKTGDASRLYLGTGMTTGTSGETCTIFGTDDTPASWLLWNYYHRAPVKLFYSDSTNSWTYQTDAFRPANGLGKLARLGFVIGVSENPVDCLAVNEMQDDGATPQNTTIAVGIGLDGFTTNDATHPQFQSATPYYLPLSPHYQGYPGIGFHYLGWTENSDGGSGGSTTWVGDGGAPTKIKCGIRATILA